MINRAKRAIRRWGLPGLLACLLLGLVSHLANAGSGAENVPSNTEHWNTTPSAAQPEEPPGSTDKYPGDVHKVPTLPWQPPAWTDHLTLQASKLVDSTHATLTTTLHELRQRLDGQGIEFTLFRIAEDGFALVTKATTASDDPTSSRSRAFIIAVTKRSPHESADHPSRPLEARKGHLPATIGDIPLDRDTKIHVFLHEYDNSDDGRAWTLQDTSQQSVADHLSEANLWSRSELASALLTTSRG